MGTDDDEDADLVVDALLRRYQVQTAADAALDGIAEMYGIDKQQAIDTMVDFRTDRVDESAVTTRMTEDGWPGSSSGGQPVQDPVRNGYVRWASEPASRSKAEFSMYGLDPFATDEPNARSTGTSTSVAATTTFDGPIRSTCTAKSVSSSKTR